MATPPVAKRFSENEKLTGDLQGTDRVTLTQQSGAVKETINVNINELSGYIADKALETGIGSLVEIGQGLKGSGTVTDPLRLDTDYLNSTLIVKDRLRVTVVGNRRTRYLPVSRSKLAGSRYYDSTSTIALAATSVEKTGELKMIRPGTTLAHSLSVGDWDLEGTLDSLQVIERRIDIKELPSSHSVIAVTGNSANAAIVITKDDNNNNWFWYATLKDGSLHEDSFTGLSRLWMSSGNVANDDLFRNACAAFQTNVGRFIVYAVRNTVDPNAPCVLKVIQVVGTGAATSIVDITNWTVSSYGGSYTGSSGVAEFKLSDKFIGTAGENCELVANNGIVAEFVNSANKPTSNLQIIQNPKNLNEVYLVVQRDHVLRATDNTKIHYTADFTLRLTITSGGTGSAVAISRYLSGRPTVSYNGDFTFTNFKQTYRTEGLGVNVGQIRTILQDGSIALFDDRAGGLGTGLIRLHKSIVGKTCYDQRDIHLAVLNNFVGDEQILNPLPQYTEVAGSKRIYIASPIRVYMNSVEYTIPAQCINLDSYVSSATTYTLGGVPTKKGKHVGLQVKAVYLYAQKSGSTVTLTISTSRLTESINNTFIAAVYYPIDTSKSSILLGQAYSRLGYHRPAYEPQGASVPVSYGHAGSQPNEYWMEQPMPVEETTLITDITFTSTNGSDPEGTQYGWYRYGAGSNLYRDFPGSVINPNQAMMGSFPILMRCVLYSRSQDGGTDSSGIYMNFYTTPTSGILDSTSAKPSTIYVEFNNNSGQRFQMERWVSGTTENASAQLYMPMLPYQSAGDLLFKSIMINSMTTPTTVRFSTTPF